MTDQKNVPGKTTNPSYAADPAVDSSDETSSPEPSTEGSPTDQGAEHGAGAASMDGEAPTGAELAARAAGGPPPQPSPPPKRTGVFLDPEDLRDHVGDLLRAMLGGYEVDAAGNFTFTHDSARIFVTIGTSPVGPTVGVFSITNVGVEFSKEVGAFLLTTNHKLGFGSFSYDPENQAVWLRHTLLGTMLDGPELQATLMAIASTAAKVDDAIRDQFGGRAFHDAPEDVQKRTRPPESEDDTPAPSNASGYL